MKYFYLAIPLLLITACVSQQPKIVETIKNTENEKHPRICPAIYMPVCATIQVECITSPCPPIQKTFSNKCVMNGNNKARFLHEGMCKTQ